ncbi:MAG: GNAT family N-acetyltransferase [Promethearchaeota archaeon]
MEKENELISKYDIEPIPFIKGKTIFLCPRNSRNAPLYAKWRNDPKVRLYDRNVTPRTVEDQKERFDRASERFPEDISFEIWHIKDNRPIGITGLNHIDWINSWANANLIIGEPDYWGKDIATEATELLVEYAFNELNLHKLQGGAAVQNIGSWTVAEKIGFEFEGIREHEMYVDGKYVDNKTYRLLKEDWMKKKKKIG